MPTEKQTPGQGPALPTRQPTSIADVVKSDDEADADDTLPTASTQEQSTPSPVTLAVTADDDDEGIDDGEGEADHALVFVHQPKCLECGHLVAFATQKYKSCHFTAGNQACPAQNIKIAIQLDTTKIVRNFLRAEEEGDTPKLSKLYLAMASKPEWGQRQILDDLAAAREKM